MGTHGKEGGAQSGCRAERQETDKALETRKIMATFPRSRVAAAGVLVGCGEWSTGAVEGLFDNPAILVESSRQFPVSQLRIIKMVTLKGSWED